MYLQFGSKRGYVYARGGRSIADSHRSFDSALDIHHGLGLDALLAINKSPKP